MTQPDLTAAGIATAVARRVRDLREKRKWSAEFLAQRLTEAGVKTVRSAVANLENGRRRDITVAEVLAYALVFRVPPALILGEPLDELPMPSQDPDEPDARITVAALVDWMAGVELPAVLDDGTAGPEFERAARPLAAHRRHAALAERVLMEYVRLAEQSPEPENERVQDLARHRLHMRALGEALDQMSMWTPPDLYEVIADPVAIAEKQLTPEYERTSSPNLESIR